MATDPDEPKGGLSMRIESVDYTVRCATAKVFSKPHSGIVVGERLRGQVLGTTLITSGEGPSDVWVRLNEVIPTSESGEGWILVDGTLLGLGLQLERKAFERPRVLKWYLTEDRVEICGGVKGSVVGHRASGRLLRTDLELTGWVRLTEDFRRPTADGSDGDICEGWVSLAKSAITRWWPTDVPRGAPPETLPGSFQQYWVVARYGVALRDKPWGNVLTKRDHGELLRGDLLQDGWLRLEEDFVKASDGGVRGKGGPLPDSVGEDEMGTTVLAEDVQNNVGGALLRGWVLVDGRDLGLSGAQCQARSEFGERAVPKPSVTQAGGGKVYISWELADEVAENLAGKFHRRRLQAESDRGEDWSVAGACERAGVGEETADVLSRCGVANLHDLITAVAKADIHEALKAVGVSRLGARTKLVRMLTPYLEAQIHKEKANALYKKGEYRRAVDTYTESLRAMTCHSATIALHTYNNRAAAHQMLGDFTEALADSLFVLRYDAANAKALARAEKARAMGAQTPAEKADAEEAKREAAAFHAAAEAAAKEKQAAEAAAVSKVEGSAVDPSPGDAKPPEANAEAPVRLRIRELLEPGAVALTIG